MQKTKQNKIKQKPLSKDFWLSSEKGYADITISIKIRKWKLRKIIEHLWGLGSSEFCLHHFLLTFSLEQYHSSPWLQIPFTQFQILNFLSFCLSALGSCFAGALHFSAGVSYRFTHFIVVQSLSRVWLFATP